MAVGTVDLPTLGEARQAADALMAAGVGQVWLFGSLARDEARSVSDIDLVAVFDDLDYRKRWRVEAELRKAASTAAGRPVDVVATDWPDSADSCRMLLERRPVLANHVARDCQV